MFLEAVFVLGAIGAGVAVSCLKVVKEYDRLVVFTLGKVSGVVGPGLQLILPGIQQTKKVDLRIITMAIPMQEIITKDNVSVKTAAVCFFQVVDPYKASYGVEDREYAIQQIAQTTMRAEIGQMTLDKTLADRQQLNENIVEAINHASESWGLRCLRYEVGRSKGVFMRGRY